MSDYRVDPDRHVKMMSAGRFVIMSGDDCSVRSDDHSSPMPTPFGTDSYANGFSQYKEYAGTTSLILPADGQGDCWIVQRTPGRFFIVAATRGDDSLPPNPVWGYDDLSMKLYLRVEEDQKVGGTEHRRVGQWIPVALLWQARGCLSANVQASQGC